MNCTKCDNPMEWTRLKFHQAKTYYCPSCGFNFKRNIFGKVKDQPIYTIGLVSDYETPVIFLSKNGLENYINSRDNVVFIHLKNSTNILTDKPNIDGWK